MHKRPLRGHCAPALTVKEPLINSSAQKRLPQTAAAFSALYFLTSIFLQPAHRPIRRTYTRSAQRSKRPLARCAMPAASAQRRSKAALSGRSTQRLRRSSTRLQTAKTASTFPR